MKSVQIPYDLFIDLAMYHLRGEDDFEEEIRQLYDPDKKEYYCIRCQYTGSEEDVLEKNRMARFRYRFLTKRFTPEEFEAF